MARQAKNYSKKIWINTEKDTVLTPEDAAKFEALMRAREERENEFTVLCVNAEALRLWERFCNVYRYAPTGDVIGLDWPGVASLLSLYREAPEPENLDRLRVIESAFFREVVKK